MGLMFASFNIDLTYKNIYTFKFALMYTNVHKCTLSTNAHTQICTNTGGQDLTHDVKGWALTVG